MVRKDFVSNSSSCSFIVHIRNDEDLNEFKKIFRDKMANYSMQMSTAYTNSFYNDTTDRVTNVDHVVAHSLVMIDCGEDNEPCWEYRWDRLVDLVSQYKFKLYRDDGAHVSIGDYLPNKGLEL